MYTVEFMKHYRPHRLIYHFNTAGFIRNAMHRGKPTDCTDQRYGGNVH